MIFHSVEYKKQIEEKGGTPGTILTVPAAEFLSGLPRGWTSPRAGDCKHADVERLFPVEEACLAQDFFLRSSLLTKHRDTGSRLVLDCVASPSFPV